MGSIKTLFEKNVPGVYVKSLMIGSNIAEVCFAVMQNISCAAADHCRSFKVSGSKNIIFGMEDCVCNPTKDKFV